MHRDRSLGVTIQEFSALRERENIERILNLHADFVNPKHHVRDGGGDDHELGERGAPRGDHRPGQPARPAT